MRGLIRFFQRLFGRSRKRKRTVHLLWVLLLAAPLMAQTAGTDPASDSPIQDNSFLIEEAYNQGPGVVQHIQTFSHATRGGDWAYSFTQEWPAPNLKHQLSYSVPIARIDGERGIGDVALNYRYQWIGDADARLAVSPRLTLLLPTGDEDRGLGSSGTGFQVMLPVSAVLTPSIVAHWNLGGTIIPSDDTHAVTAGQSIVWLTSHRFNMLVETVWTRTSDPSGHESEFIVNPGIRWSYDLPHDLQIVPGIAFPMTSDDKAVFLYLSFEHPF
jgi:outer membrane putative beta-barrel porin/alpha-amylase